MQWHDSRLHKKLLISILHIRIFHDKWIHVTITFPVLRLYVEERSSIWWLAANILIKQLPTADKVWSSSLWVLRRCWKFFTVKSGFVTKYEHLLRTLVRTKQGKTTLDLVRGLLETCICVVYLQQQPGN